MTIKEFYELAWFSDLAYVRWSEADSLSSVQDLIDTSRLQERAPDGESGDPGASATGLATKIFDPRYEAWQLAHFTPNDPETGFAATLFNRDGPSGVEKVLAVRGTEFGDGQLVPDLIVADLQEAGGLGIALSQAVSLTNYVRRLQAAAGTPVTQFEIRQGSSVPPDAVHVLAAGERFLWLSGAAPEPGLGLLAPGEAVSVTGHSLGGHLAALAIRLFPDQFEQAVTFNAPGFDARLGLADTEAIITGLATSIGSGGLLLAGNVLTTLLDSGEQLSEPLLRNLFDPQPGIVPAPSFADLAGAGRIVSLVSEDQSPVADPDFVSAPLVTGQPASPHRAVTVELNSHAMGQFVDALGVHALLERIDPGIELETAGAVMALASAQPEASGEAVLNLLSRLVGLDVDSDLPVSAPPGPTQWIAQPAPYPARGALHARIIALESVLGAGFDARIEPLHGHDATALATLARTDPAYRQALVALNPFTLGADGDLYAAFGAAPEYSRYSEAYWNDRAGFLERLLAAHRADAAGPDGVPHVARERNVDFIDEASGLRLAQVALSGIPAGLRGDAVELLRGPHAGAIDSVRFAAGIEVDGGAGDDRLYGNDFANDLYGHAGADYLEGGAGDDDLYHAGASHADDRAVDRLAGGAGLDRYYAGHGDEVYDSDRRAVIHVGPANLALGGEFSRVAPNVYRNDTLDATLYLAERDARAVSFHGGEAVAITLVDFRDGPGQFRAGDYGIVLRESAEDGDLPQRLTGTAGNDRAGEALIGSDGDDLIEGLAGDDDLFGGRGADQWGADRFLGGAGDDFISSATPLDVASPVVRPDDPGDIVDAGDGDDIVAGAGGNDQHYGGAGRDFLSGRGGRDVLHGGPGDDVLAGGGGDDLLIGGTGDDVLHGAFDVRATPARAWSATPRYSADGRLVDIEFGGVVLGPNPPPDDADILYAGDGADFLNGGNGDDGLYGEAGDDVLFGWRGADVLDGGSGNDVLYGDSGGLAAPGGEGGDTLYGGAGDDTLYGESGDDRADGGAGDDRLFGGAGSDDLDGGEGADTLDGEAGDDLLDGGPGDDVVRGGAGADYLSGGAGDDQLAGGTGHDVYLYRPGDGHDRLDDGGGYDVVLLEQVADLAAATLQQGADELVLEFDADNSLTIGDWGGGGIDAIHAGGQVLHAGGVATADAIGRFVPVPDRFDGGDDTRGNVLLIGGTATTVTGGRGHDRFELAPRVGRVVIDDRGGEDVIVLPAAVTPEALTIASEDRRIVLSAGTFEVDFDAGAIERVLFADGSEFGRDWLTARVPRAPAPETSADVAVTAEDEPVTLDVLANDAGSSALSLVRVGGARHGQTVITDDGRVVYAPERDFAGTDAFLYEVMDADGALAVGSVSVTVSATPDAPIAVATLPDVSATTSRVFSYALPETAFVDPDAGDRLSYTARLAGGAALPDWLGFDAHSRRFSGTPPLLARGESHEIEVVASDQTGRSASASFWLDVFPPPRGDNALAIARVEDLTPAQGLLTPAAREALADPYAALTADYLARAGDLDADGVDDLVRFRAGAPFDDADRLEIVFGRRDGFGGVLPADAAAAVTITGAGAWSSFGALEAFEAGAVSSSDVDGDGIDDLVVLPGAGAERAAEGARVLLGRLTAFRPQMAFADLPTLDAVSNTAVSPVDAWFPANLARDGVPYEELGDVDGDGLADRAYALSSFAIEDVVTTVVFGSPAPVTADLDAAALDGMHGFRIVREFATAGDGLGSFGPAVSALGDVNGDGFDDIGLSSQTHSFESTEHYVGVVFGKPSGYGGRLNLADLDGSNGFLASLPGDLGQTLTHYARGAGDVNGDGLADVVVSSSFTRASHVIYGARTGDLPVTFGSAGIDDLEVVSARAVFAGAGSDRVRVGAAAGGANVYGGSGDDRVVLQPGPASGSVAPGSTFTFRGGSGEDVYVIHSTNGALRVRIIDPVPSLARLQPGYQGNRLVLGPGYERSALNLGLGSVVLDFGDDRPVIQLDSLDPDDVLGGPRDVEQIEFADGTVLSYEALVAQGFDIGGDAGDDLLRGTSMVDRISGGDGDDTLVGGSGDDRLDGGAGDDRYVFGPGHGHDVIVDTGGDDRLVLTHRTASDALDAEPGPAGVRISFGEGASVVVPVSGAGAPVIERIEFADGSTQALAGLLSPGTLTVTIPDQLLTEDTHWAFDAGGAYFAAAGVPGPLTYSATLTDGSALPSWIRFDEHSGALRASPGNDAVGSHGIVVSATAADGAMLTATFGLTVTNVNDVPFILTPLPDASFTAGEPFTLAIPPHTFADADAGDRLAITVRAADGGALPTWLAFDSATGILSGVAVTAGTLTLAAVATDLSGAVAENRFTLDIAPELNAVAGTHGDDVLLGTAGADAVDAGRGDDHVETFAGDDVVHGRDGSDTIETGSGDDTVRGGNGDDVIDGGAGDNRLYGDAGADRIRAGAGDDVIAGGYQDDHVDAGDGHNTVYGGPGDDVILSGSGDDRLIANSGNDRVEAGAGNNHVEGGDGNDVIVTSAGDDFIDGGYDDDCIEAGAGDDIVYGYYGNDVIDAGSGSNVVHAGPGADHVITRQGADHLDGGSGADILDSGAGDDRLEGGNGDDVLLAGAGDDDLDGGYGDDLLETGGGVDRAAGGAGNDTYRIAGDSVVTVYDRSGSADLLLFEEASIAAADLWFRRRADDLLVEQRNGMTTVTVTDWYVHPDRRIERFGLADGASLEAGEVAGLVQAMAAFDPPPTGEGSVPEPLPPALEPVIAAAWQVA